MLDPQHHHPEQRGEEPPESVSQSSHQESVGMTESKKQKKSNGADTPPPLPADPEGDHGEVLVNSENGKSSESPPTLGQPAAATSGGKTEEASDLLSLVGGDKKILTMLDDAVAARQQEDENARKVLDLEESDLERAKAAETMAGIDAVRGEEIADALITRHLKNGNEAAALDILYLKHKIRGNFFDAVSKRKKLELEDVASARRQIVQKAINFLVEDLSVVLADNDFGDATVSKILQGLSDQQAIRSGDEFAGV